MQYIDRGVCFIELEQAFAGEFTKPIDSVHLFKKWIFNDVIWLLPRSRNVELSSVSSHEGVDDLSGKTNEPHKLAKGLMSLPAVSHSFIAGELARVAKILYRNGPECGADEKKSSFCPLWHRFQRLLGLKSLVCIRP
ncbi:hypothetical protein AYI72_16545 [Shewanella algae]|uniref:hypothetical protein n=1 Tax=Shewanella algae TaxID=38313 RepID=UPI000E3315BD|nr:hypothetical protein [Shewanella algae]AXQ13473.1 hypothetical protein BS332_03125 [Shewanella algae]QXP19901.1 hypothetical protein KE621_03140 [Shewanella algae]QXP29531.1 hypothetical protein KE622_19545 [Shewanella algae]QXP33475.1 hypothetical protein KE623_17655 [Shewanella algae]QXP38694.1 hypothetical protein KE624_02765 [Shewanella algae]